MMPSLSEMARIYKVDGPLASLVAIAFPTGLFLSSFHVS